MYFLAFRCNIMNCRINLVILQFERDSCFNMLLVHNLKCTGIAAGLIYLKTCSLVGLTFKIFIIERRVIVVKDWEPLINIIVFLMLHCSSENCDCSQFIASISMLKDIEKTPNKKFLLPALLSSPNELCSRKNIGFVRNTGVGRNTITGFEIHLPPPFHTSIILDSNPPSSAIIQSVPQAAAPSSKRAAASINAITRTTSLRGSSNLGASSVVKTYQHHCQSRSRLIIPHGKILSSKQPVVIDKTQHPVALFSFFSHPMSKDQITDHIASSLGLCPIKDSSTQPPHLSQGRKLSDVYSKKNITSNSYDNKNLEKTTNKQWAPVNVNNSKQHLPPNASFTAGSSKLSSSLGSGHTYRSSPIPATKKFISQNSPRVALSSPELTSLVPGQLPLKQSSSHPNSTTFGGHSLEGVVPEGLSMYPTGYQPNQATQAANMGTYGAQAAGLSSGFQSQLPLSPNVIPFSNQTSYFAANPAASLGGVPQQQVQVMNPLQAANQMQSNAVSYNPQLVQYQPGGTASNLHRLSSQSYQTHTNPNSMTLLGSSQASMTQFAQQPSNYPAGFSSVNLASLGGQPQALGLGAPQSLGHVAGSDSNNENKI